MIILNYKRYCHYVAVFSKERHLHVKEHTCHKYIEYYNAEEQLCCSHFHKTPKKHYWWTPSLNMAVTFSKKGLHRGCSPGILLNFSEQLFFISFFSAIFQMPNVQKQPLEVCLKKRCS